MLKAATLPRLVDFRRLAAHDGVLRGEVPVAELTRFAELLQGGGGAVSVDLQCGHDEDGNATVKGRADCTVRVLCQRCLEQMELSLSAGIALGVVSSEADAGRLPASLEPLVQGAEPLDAYEVLADELILSLPLVSFHPPELCAVAQDYSTGAAADEPAASGKPSPFGVLASLKVSKTTDSDS